MVVVEGTRVRRREPVTAVTPAVHRSETRVTPESSRSSLEYGLVKTGELTVFPQIRVLFEDIDVLADDIAGHGGLIQPITVALLTEAQALGYVEGFNHVWEQEVVTSKDIKWIRHNGKRMAKVLIDGERRTRAFRLLETAGCSTCREKHGEGSCISRHIPEGTMRTTYRIGISYTEALRVQYSANLSKPNYPHEYAEAFRRALRAEQLIDSSFSNADLARKYGIARSTVIEMMAFAELPASIKDLVARKRIDYGHAVVLH